MNLLEITWTVDPAIFTIGAKEIRWYGLSFIVGFYIGYSIVKKMWRQENLNLNRLDPLLYYTIGGTVIGARLGHCLFYDPAYYLSHPFEILKMWEGGLASHGGVLGIIIAIYFFSKYVSHKSMIWTFDKLVVPTGLVAALIRLGNLMNHEIYGHPTDLPWGFRFVTNLFTFALCMWMYFNKKAWKREGLIFGVFMICVFTARFVIEFWKNDQEAFEAGMVLNMGQCLSIPFILAGIFFVWRACKNPNIKKKR